MKTPLVLLHGWGVNSLIWQPLLPELESEFDLSVLDLPGYGDQVDFSGDYCLPNIVDDVLSRAPDRAVWVGWSFGGTVAMSAALEHPERFLKLQLISTTPCFLNQEDWGWGVDLEPFEKLAQQFEQDYAKAIKKFLLLQANTSDRSKLGDAKTMVRETAERLLSVPPPGANSLRGGLSILKETDLRTQIGELTVPTQVVAGLHDQVVPFAASYFLGSQLPLCEEICAIESGHLPFIEAAGEYLGLLDSFATSKL